MNPRYPVFIPSKGRWESRYTIKCFERMGVPFKVVVEKQEYDQYASVVDPSKILVLPHRDKGLVVTRNWIWDYAESLGVKRFWTFDDNIRAMHRLHQNKRVKVLTPTPLAILEDFVDRFTNVTIAGFQYAMFAPDWDYFPPVSLNTRVYSNMLIDTFARSPRGRPYRNEGFYNDDTDLCLRVLKDGNCTVLCNAFLILKQATMKVKGGMTPHYQGEGRLRMAEELRRKHPDVTRITVKWGRYQHHVDYRKFKDNKLRLKPGVVLPTGVNEYDLVHIVEK